MTEEKKTILKKRLTIVGHIALVVMEIAAFILSIISFFKNNLILLGNIFIAILVIDVIALIIFGIYATCLWFYYKNLLKETKSELDLDKEKHNSEKNVLIKQNDFLKKTIEFSRKHNDQCVLQINKSISDMTICLDKIYEILEQDNEPKYKNKQIIETMKNMQSSVKKRYNVFLGECTNNLKKVLDESFQNKNLNIINSVSLKQLNSALDWEVSNYDRAAVVNTKIITAYRNSDAYGQKREVGTLAYSISGNSDFNHCLNNSSYLKNNIVPKDMVNYQNENKDFLTYYNCTIVVPIFIKAKTGKKIYGYLTADTLNSDSSRTKVYDEDETTIMTSVASIMAIYFTFMQEYWGDTINTINSLLGENIKNIDEISKDKDKDKDLAFDMEMEFLTMIYKSKFKPNSAEVKP